MKFKSLFALLALSTVTLVSCQKEITDFRDSDNPFNSGNPDGLLRSVSTLVDGGTDTIKTHLEYDANKRLIKYYVTGKATENFAVGNGQIIQRDGAGNILSMKSYEVDPSTNNTDTAYTFAHYDASGKMDYTVTLREVLGTPLRDSVVLGYDASGNIVSQTSYNDWDDYTIPLSKVVTIYNASNDAVGQKVYQYDEDNSEYILLMTFKYTVDDKAPYYQPTVQEVGIGLFEFYTTHNVTKVEITNEQDPSSKSLTTSVYQYASNGKPEKGDFIATFQDQTVKTRNYYYYQ